MPNNSITPAEKTQTMNLGGTMAFVQAVIQRFRSEVISPLIPSQASAQNQLADKAFVNSSIATATATYRGSYNLVSDLELTVSATEQQIAAALATEISTADNNDYCYVQIPAADATPTVIAQIDRYKHNGTAWSLEYTLNNSGFTAAEWAAIQSGITAAHVTKLNGIEAGAQAHIAPTTAEVNAALGTGSGTTKFYREDGTWQEVDAAPEVQIGGVAPGSGSDIKLFVDENSDDTIEVYTKAQATGQFMVVVNSVSVPTASTLTYTATDGTTKSFKVGDEIRVPDAEADNGYTFYKLYALTTEEGVTTATWDKLGAGGAVPVNPNETVNISLTQVGGNSADLTGASVTITDDDSGDTLYTGTWAGTMLTTEISVNTNYTVDVEAITGYQSTTSSSYTAQYQNERNILFRFVAIGVYIEATDGTLYTSSTWSGSGKTPNSVVVITSTMKRRIALIEYNTLFASDLTGLSSYTYVSSNTTPEYLTDGESKTASILTWLNATGKYNASYAVPKCTSYIFPNGSKGAYLGGWQEMLNIYNNKSKINACFTALGNAATPFCSSTAQDGARYLSCETSTMYDGTVFTISWNTGTEGNNMVYESSSHYVRPISKYEL